jgi:hypothetical protein
VQSNRALAGSIVWLQARSPRNNEGSQTLCRKTGQSPSAFSVCTSKAHSRRQLLTCCRAKAPSPMCIPTADLTNDNKFDLAVSPVNTSQIVDLVDGGGAVKAPILPAVDLLSAHIPRSRLARRAAAVRHCVLEKLQSEKRAGLRVDRQKPVNTERFHNRRTLCTRMQGYMPPHVRFGQ